jgi:hypothetical protein
MRSRKPSARPGTRCLRGCSGITGNACTQRRTISAQQSSKAAGRTQARRPPDGYGVTETGGGNMGIDRDFHIPPPRRLRRDELISSKMRTLWDSHSESKVTCILRLSGVQNGKVGGHEEAALVAFSSLSSFWIGLIRIDTMARAERAGHAYVLTPLQSEMLVVPYHSAPIE